MPFTAEQHNFYDDPARLFYMDASMCFVPVQVLHRYVGHSAACGRRPPRWFPGDGTNRAESMRISSWRSTTAISEFQPYPSQPHDQHGCRRVVARADAHRHAPTHSASMTSCNNDVHRSVPINHISDRGFRGYLTQSCTYGSVRGAAGNRRSYRDESPAGIRTAMHRPTPPRKIRAAGAPARWLRCSSFKYGRIFSVVAPSRRGASPFSVLARAFTTG